MEYEHRRPLNPEASRYLDAFGGGFHESELYFRFESVLQSYLRIFLRRRFNPWDGKVYTFKEQTFVLRCCRIYTYP